MESKIKSSFIPKSPVAQTKRAPSARYKSSGMDIVMLLAVISLVVSGVLSVGVFLYKKLAVADAESKIVQLEKSREAFDLKLIERMRLLSERIRVAEGVLEKHTAPSVFLQSLENDTLTGVQFTEFEYSQKNPDKATFSLKGKASSVNSIALQSSRFGESNIIKDPIFSDIDLVKDGVVFSVEGDINLSAIQYSSAITMSQLQDQLGEFNSVTEPESENFEIGDVNEFGDFGNLE